MGQEHKRIFYCSFQLPYHVINYSTSSTALKQACFKRNNARFCLVSILVLQGLGAEHTVQSIYCFTGWTTENIDNKKVLQTYNKMWHIYYFNLFFLDIKAIVHQEINTQFNMYAYTLY